MSWKTARAQLGSATRRYGADSPPAVEARRELRAARAEEYIRELVESAPPLTPTQLERLALLLRPAVKTAAAQRATRGAA